MITSPHGKSPRQIAIPHAGVRQRYRPVVFSDRAYSDGEALIVDVRAGVTPAEHVQRKLMSLLHG